MKTSKPKLIVTALSATPFSGSEPGKAFNWTLAVSKFFEVHVLLLADKINKCEESGLCSDWIFHPINIDGPTQGGIPFYIWYAKWCRAVEDKCSKLLSKDSYVGIHHPVLGSFRMFPRYDRLGITYSLGPLGGGETAPEGLLRDCGFPPIPRILESTRPLLNALSIRIPSVRRVIRKSAGSLNTAIVFPDIVDVLMDSNDRILALRKKQASDLPEKFRLVFSGRSLWWKGGSVAVRFIHRLLSAGVEATLDVFGDGPAMAGWRDLAAKLGISRDRITFHGMVERKHLLEAYASSHLFIYPTFHDSSSSAIPEAYSTGLPSMTLFCGGTRTAAIPGGGINFTPRTINEFYDQGLADVRRWIKDPSLWIECCKQALEASKKFSHEAIENAVEKELVPIFTPES